MIVAVSRYCFSTRIKTMRVFENRVLRRIFRPKRDEVTGEWRKLHNDELHNLYSSPHIIRQVKSRRMRWVGHVARIGEERKVYKVLGTSGGKDHLEDQSVGVKMGSEWILGRLAWEVWIGFDWLRTGTGGRAVVSAAMNLRVLAPRC
jgi:hypothetical protein